MRLLHSKTYRLEVFSSPPPPYAILSHTWENEEVTFQDMQGDQAEATAKWGFRKIEGCCRQARKDGFEWVWIDTCCIDKSSSAELSEAINSMYWWYQGSSACYAYLADVPRLTLSPFLGNHNEFLEGDMGPGFIATRTRERHSFRNSRWFERGWTLQELIAPRNVEFYASDWSEIGTKISLTSLIEEITGIQVDVICGRPPSGYTVATRMSWAAGRETTRQEDLAYCLLGIFDVNMPLLYGEGTRAFQRLQEEILQKSEAWSLLAWTIPPSSLVNVASTSGSILAKGPNLFRHLSARTIDDGSEQNEYYTLARQQFDDKLTIDYSEGSFRVSDSRHAFDPPTITSRGILATLLTIPLVVEADTERADRGTPWWTTPIPKSDSAPWWGDTLDSPGCTMLAWTFCDSPHLNRSVCILLKVASDHRVSERDTKSQALAVRRVFRDVTISIPSQHLSRFRPTPLYLSAAESPDLDTRSLRGVSWNTSATCLLKGICLSVPQTGVSVTETFPRRQIQQVSPGTYFLGSPRWDGMDASIVRLELSAIFISIIHQDGIHPYVILFGLSEQGGNVYCNIQPIQEGAALSVQTPFFEHFIEDLHRGLAVKTDRVVRSFLGFNIQLRVKRVGASMLTTGNAYNLLLSMEVGCNLGRA